jgi:hypothetical protein
LCELLSKCSLQSYTMSGAQATLENKAMWAGIQSEESTAMTPEEERRQAELQDLRNKKDELKDLDKRLELLKDAYEDGLKRAKASERKWEDLPTEKKVQRWLGISLSNEQFYEKEGNGAYYKRQMGEVQQKIDETWQGLEQYEITPGNEKELNRALDEREPIPPEKQMPSMAERRAAKQAAREQQHMEQARQTTVPEHPPAHEFQHASPVQVTDQPTPLAQEPPSAHEPEPQTISGEGYTPNPEPQPTLKPDERAAHSRETVTQGYQEDAQARERREWSQPNRTPLKDTIEAIRGPSTYGDGPLGQPAPRVPPQPSASPTQPLPSQTPTPTHHVRERHDRDLRGYRMEDGGSGGGPGGGMPSLPPGQPPPQGTALPVSGQMPPSVQGAAPPAQGFVGRDPRQDLRPQPAEQQQPPSTPPKPSSQQQVGPGHFKDLFTIGEHLQDLEQGVEQLKAETAREQQGQPVQWKTPFRQLFEQGPHAPPQKEPEQDRSR